MVIHSIHFHLSVEMSSSLLARAQTARTRADLDAAIQLWRRVRLLYIAHFIDPAKPLDATKQKRYHSVVGPCSFLICQLHDLKQ